MEKSNQENLGSYPEMLSLIQIDVLNHIQGTPSSQSLRNVLLAFRKLHNLLQSTVNPYEYQVISKTLKTCFDLIARSYQLTQCITDKLYMEEKMILQDIMFVGNTLEHRHISSCWVPKEKDRIASLFASLGTAHDRRGLLENTYPLPEKPWTPKSMDASLAMQCCEIQSEHESSNLQNILEDLEHSWKPSLERFWSMEDAVQVMTPVQDEPPWEDLVLSSIYRDVPIPKQHPTKQKSGGRALAEKRKDLNKIVRGTSVSFAANRLYCRLVTSLTAESSSRAALLVGPDGCGKATLCQKIANLLGATFIDLNNSIIALHSEVGEEPSNQELQECIHKEFQRARGHAPCIILIRNSERMFISSSNRDGEFESSKIFRSMKPYVLEAVQSMPWNSNVFVLGASSRPDDCVGKDKEEFIAFYNTDIITMTHPDHHSRMARIITNLQKHNMPHIPWPVLSELTSVHSEASWRDIDCSIENISKTVHSWRDLLEEVEMNLRHTSALQLGNRCSRMVDIETWVQDTTPLFLSFKNIRV